MSYDPKLLGSLKILLYCIRLHEDNIHTGIITIRELTPCISGDGADGARHDVWYHGDAVLPVRVPGQHYFPGLFPELKGKVVQNNADSLHLHSYCW